MKQIIILIGVVLIVWFAYYTISPLFRVVEVDDTLPDNLIEESSTSTADNMASGVENLRIDQQMELEKIMKDMNKIVPPTMDDTNPEEGVVLDDTVIPPPGIAIMHTTAHPASGSVRVLETTEGTVIRYEDFETINGPNLHIYLANDLKATDYYDLGEIKGTRGNINYAIPDEVNVADYKYVMYWCVPFGVLFNYAEIN